MPQLKWLGEDALHGEGEQPPSYNTWNGIKFPKGVQVELNGKVQDKAIIERMLLKAGKEFWEIIPDEEPKRDNWTSEQIAALERHGQQPVVVHEKRGPGRPPNPPKGYD